MSLVIPPTFQHILRVMNTNIDGKRNIMFAITAIKGVGRRYANLVLKKADIDLSKRAGELSEEDVEKIITIMQNPRQYKIPNWFLNRQKDIKDGKLNILLNFAGKDGWKSVSRKRLILTIFETFFEKWNRLTHFYSVKENFSFFHCECKMTHSVEISEILSHRKNIS